jgi:predicted alpha/beta-fold hydrolase
VPRLDPPAPDWFEPFRRRWPIVGPDAQTLAYDAVAKQHAGLDGFRHESLQLPVDDDSGDQLIHEVNFPTDRRPGPTAVLWHGFGGTARSGYLELAARAFLDAGWPAVRCNNRGCGLSRSTAATAHWPGDVALVRSTIDHLHAHRPDLAEHGLYLVGFSLGTCALTHYLADAGDAARCLGGTLVSAPIDLVMTSRQLSSWRTFPYRRFLLPKVKHEVLRPNVRAHTDDLVHAKATAARTVWQFDDVYNAPRLGHAGAEQFYRAYDLHDALPKVRRPLVVLHSRDDPFVPFRMHADFDFAQNDHLHPIHTSKGGHCGFHGQGHPIPWCSRLAVEHATRLANG